MSAGFRRLRGSGTPHQFERDLTDAAPRAVEFVKLLTKNIGTRQTNPQGQFRYRKPRFRRLIAKSSMSFEPDRRKSRKSTFLHLQVSQTLSKTRVSRRLFSVVSPSITRRSNANAFTACSALLLFHGTSSKSRKVNILLRFFCKRSTSLPAA